MQVAQPKCQVEPFFIFPSLYRNRICSIMVNKLMQMTNGRKNAKSKIRTRKFSQIYVKLCKGPNLINLSFLINRDMPTAQISIVERCYWTQPVEYVSNKTRRWPMHFGVVLWPGMCGR